MRMRFTAAKRFIYALATLTGTIIGVGVFALPFVASKVGLPIMLLYFLLLGAVVVLIHLLYAEVVVRTEGLHRLPGYVERYLGRWGKRLVLLEKVFAFSGTLLAYLIVGGTFLSSLLSPIFGIGQLGALLLFFFAGAVLVYFGIRSIAKVELFALFLFGAVLLALLSQGHSFLNLRNLFNFEASSLFLPYGVILFALWGAALVPEAAEMLGRQVKPLRRLIFWAISLVAGIYLFFTLLITGITGELTSRDALTALKYFFGDGLVALALAFGVLACFTSFITLGLTFKKVLWYDFKVKQDVAWAVAVFLPLLLYFIGLKDFIRVIGTVGGVMLGIEGIIIVLLYLKVREKEAKSKPPLVFGLPRAILWPVILMLVLGIIYEVVYFFK